MKLAENGGQINQKLTQAMLRSRFECIREGWGGADYLMNDEISLDFRRFLQLLAPLLFTRRGRQVVRPRTANPLSSVRFRPAPPLFKTVSEHIWGGFLLSSKVVVRNQSSLDLAFGNLFLRSFLFARVAQR
jgi:hypothetical protein